MFWWQECHLVENNKTFRQRTYRFTLQTLLPRICGNPRGNIKLILSWSFVFVERDFEMLIAVKDVLKMPNACLAYTLTHTHTPPHPSVFHSSFLSVLETKNHSVDQSVCLSVWLCGCVPVCVCVCTSVFLSTYASVHVCIQCPTPVCTQCRCVCARACVRALVSMRVR